MMKTLVCVLLLVPLIAPGAAENSAPKFDAEAAERFAHLALACVDQEYPNKISHVLNSDADVAPPRKLTPAFYGCYDWHSSVHGHWLLVRLARKFPEAPFAKPAREALRKSLTAENLKQEAAYLREKGRANFERPYGLAWLLQLVAELRRMGRSRSERNAGEPASAGRGRARSIEDVVAEAVASGSDRRARADRLRARPDAGLCARRRGNESFAKLLSDQARKFYLADKNCPMAYEPSGEDFLSPCLAEADVMRRVLPPAEFASWLKEFMPQIPTDGQSCLAAGHCLARSERSKARASRRIEPEPRLDARGNYLSAPGGRCAATSARRGRRGPPARRPGGRDRRALRRWALAGQFRGLSGLGAGNSARQAEVAPPGGCASGRLVHDWRRDQPAHENGNKHGNGED